MDVTASHPRHKTRQIMVGAVLTDKSPVTLRQVTPIARLTAEYEVLTVPAPSPLRNMP